MLFKECKFNTKREVRKQVKQNIIRFLKKELKYEEYNEGAILMYIDFLLNETHYDIKQNLFYYKCRWVRINLSEKLLQLIVLEYIQEHLNDFILEKHK